MSKLPRAKKRLSQHFLVDGNMARKIAELACLTPEDVVIEIGAGTGALTRHLLTRAAHVHAVEVDRELFEGLGVEFDAAPRLSLHRADILELRIRDLVPDRRAVVVGNLPYGITSDLVLWLLDQHADIRRAVILMQREVAHRLEADPGERAAGPLTLTLRYRAEAEGILDVPPSCFRPVPKVHSRLLALKFLEEPRVKPRDERFFLRLIRAAFAERRKTLVNSVTSSLHVPHEDVESAVRAAGLDPLIRGERLQLEDFRRLADLLAPSPAETPQT